MIGWQDVGLANPLQFYLLVWEDDFIEKNII